MTSETTTTRTTTPPRTMTTMAKVTTAAQTTTAATCDEDTTGTCWLFGCKAIRGPVSCVGDKCLCIPGYCSDSFGICRRESSAVQAVGSLQLPEKADLYIAWRGPVAFALLSSISAFLFFGSVVARRRQRVAAVR